MPLLLATCIDATYVRYVRTHRSTWRNVMSYSFLNAQEEMCGDCWQWHNPQHDLVLERVCKRKLRPGEEAQQQFQFIRLVCKRDKVSRGATPSHNRCRVRGERQAVVTFSKFNGTLKLQITIKRYFDTSQPAHRYGDIPNTWEAESRLPE